MASLKPKPPLVIIPDLGNSEKSFCGLCLVSNTGHLELLHHNISAPHIKNLRARIRFQSQCMICRVHISDIKAAEAHVQDSRHEKRLNYNFSLKEAASVVDQTYKCPPCHLVFNCCIALELHLLMTHKVRFSKENLPELTDIIWLLSGSSVDASKVSIKPECDLCNFRCEAMDDFLMHLFSYAHMKPLRTSTCIVCELTFIHVNDRESHLHACKHKVNLQKFCLTKRLRKLDEMEQVENIQYICMYCMVQCKSWPCFILHLISSAHMVCAENQDRQQNVVHTELQEKVVTDESSPVSSISGKKWKRWLDQSTALSAWCFVCEEMLSTPETLEKHLKGHNGQEGIHIKKKSHWMNTLFKEGKACDYLECEVCHVAFKNEFSLAVHKSLRQHHIQQALVSNGGISCHCYDCRMRGRSIAIEQIILPKSNFVIVDGDKLEQNVITIQHNSAEELKLEVHKESSVKMFSKTSESTRFKDNHEVHESSGVDETSPPGEKTEIDASDQVLEENNLEHLTGRHETNVLICQEQTRKMVPVVIAAALPPSNSIHNSIQSALILVKESLSAAVPKIRKSSSEVFSANKRLKGNIHDTAVDKHDCRSLQPILEAAVSEGLQAFFSQSSLREASTSVEKSDNNIKTVHKTSSSTCDMENVSVSIENIEGVSVAIAAAIIPQYSSTEITLHTCTTKEKHPSLSRSNHEKEHQTSIDHVESSRLRKVFKETNCHDEKLCIQDSTQHIDIVYQEDTSSDSDDCRVYLSPNDSESSED